MKGKSKGKLTGQKDQLQLLKGMIHSDILLL